MCTHRRNVLAVQVLLVGGEQLTVAARLVGECLLEVGGDAAAVGARGAGQTARGRTGALCGWKKENINCDVIVMSSEQAARDEEEPDARRDMPTHSWRAGCWSRAPARLLRCWR